MIFKTLHLCPTCKATMETAYKLAEIPNKEPGSIKTAPCENCGAKTVLTLCTIRSKKEA